MPMTGSGSPVRGMGRVRMRSTGPPTRLAAPDAAGAARAAAAPRRSSRRDHVTLDLQRLVLARKRETVPQPDSGECHRQRRNGNDSQPECLQRGGDPGGDRVAPAVHDGVDEVLRLVFLLAWNVDEES